MEIVIDPAKDTINRAKHGVALQRAAELTDLIVVPDDRFEEQRFRLYDWIEGTRYCAAVAIRGGIVRVISLRRAHQKEFRRHGQ